MTVGIHIFRRDLRLGDNPALHLLSKQVDKIIGVFIFDPYQIKETPENKSYRSTNCIKFMCESLEDLDTDLKTHGSKLYCLYGTPHKVLDKLIKQLGPTHVSYNADYSPYSLKRDELMDETCESLGVKLIKYMDDHTINTMELFLNKDKPFRIYGAFYKHALKVKPRDIYKKPSEFAGSTYKLKSQVSNDFSKYYPKTTNNLTQGGRTRALKILANIGKFKGYNDNRDDLTYQTTLLSGYMKFGNVSVCEVFAAIKKSSNPDLLKQIYWRQFWFVLSRFFHSGYTHSDEFFKDIKWKNDLTEARALWDKAKTGFPCVDAAMRQLKEEGYMHNRGRLIVSSFAVKVLHQDPFGWKSYGGQHVFSRMLYDSCYANNYGNWNFTLGPYDLGGFRFGKAGTKGGRMIDPTNFKKWDPELKYVRKYIKELDNVPDRDVFNWNTAYKKYPAIDYPGPIVDYKKRKAEWYVLTKRKD